jgi:hypothetical protein
MFEMKKAVLLTCMAIAMAASAGAKAAVFDFSSSTGDLGLTHTYSSGSLTTVLTAFGTPAADLYGKHAGGDENGVGLSSDTAEHEILFGKGFIQIDTAGLTAIQLAFGSTTDGEQWSIFGSNTAGVLGSVVLSGAGDGTNTPVLASYRYYDVESSANAGGRNVLLRSMTANAAEVTPHGGVPEPATWAMMMVGFGAMGATLRRRRAVSAAVAA